MQEIVAFGAQMQQHISIHRRRRMDRAVDTRKRMQRSGPRLQSSLQIVGPNAITAESLAAGSWLANWATRFGNPASMALSLGLARRPILRRNSRNSAF